MRRTLTIGVGLLLLLPSTGNSAITAAGFHPAELAVIRQIPAWTELRGGDEGVNALATIGRRLGHTGLTSSRVAAALRQELTETGGSPQRTEMSLLLMAATARRLGLQAELYDTTPEALARLAPGTVLVALRDRQSRLHLRILEDAVGDPLRLFHPRRGSRKMRRNDFLTAWDGQVLQLSRPEGPADPGQRLVPLPPSDPRWSLRSHLDP